MATMPSVPEGTRIRVPDPSPLPDAPPWRPRLLASVLVAALTLGCFLATLAPGLDFGDTAAYQAAVGEWRLTPRQAYPLYFGIANTIFAVIGGEPARSLNVTSALAGAAACGALVWLASGLAGSIAAGMWAGFALGVSYTFWSQAIIGEVYTLHLLLTAMVLNALAWWSHAPSYSRLATVFGLYALGFGNHLMMVLLAPPIVAWIALTPGGLRQLLSLRGLGIAAGCAIAGASQYLWNASFLWLMADPPPAFLDGLRIFWFDVTKSDWRSTMVLGVHETALKRRVGLYWFDLQQQVGLAGVVLAVAGVMVLVRRWRLLAVLALAYLTAFGFAYTYNVGDVHVFFLPSHQIVILLAACGVGALADWVARRARRHAALAGAAATLLLFAVPAWRLWDTWPAVDRHDDRRPVAWLDHLTRDLDGRALLLADINWQLENGLDYYTRRRREDLNVARVSDRVLSLPFLVRDNLTTGRDVVMTPVSRQLAEAAYGDLFSFTPDSRTDARPLRDRMEPLSPGTVYVLALLAPYNDLPFDRAELAAATGALTGDAATIGDGPPYQVVAGRVGERPALLRKDERPFRTAVTLGEVRLDIRMESWLPADTMRRAGFGHVIANRHHVLTLERGVSVVLLDEAGAVRMATYASGLFAPLPRVFTRWGSGTVGP